MTCLKFMVFESLFLSILIYIPVVWVIKCVVKTIVIGIIFCVSCLTSSVCFSLLNDAGVVNILEELANRYSLPFDPICSPTDAFYSLTVIPSGGHFLS